MKNSHPLDDLDRAILSELRKLPQQTNKSVADKLSITEVTIASRIRAMESDGVMKVMAQKTFKSVGYDVLANVDLSIRGRAAELVAEELSDIEEIAVVTLNIGDPSLSLLVMAKDLTSLQADVIEKIANIKGVWSVETIIYADIVKYQSDFALL